MKRLLTKLIEEDDILDPINYNKLKIVKWSGTSPYRFNELILKISPKISKSILKSLLSCIPSTDPSWESNDGTGTYTEVLGGMKDNDLKTKLPRKHQVKVLLNDVEIKYLDSLIGVIGDDKASVFRNLLHTNFQKRVSSDASKQHQKSESSDERTDKHFEEDVVNEFSDYNLVSQLTEISNSLIARGVTRQNQQFVSGTEENLLEWVKQAAKSDSVRSLTFWGKANNNPLINIMHDHIKGIKLIYEGSIHERLDEASSEYTTFIFHPE